MAGPSDELPIPQRLQAITAQWDQLREGFDDATLAARVAELGARRLDRTADR